MKQKKPKDSNAEVTWSEGGYWAPLTSGDSCGYCGGLDWPIESQREIIGNIRENPELLEKRND